MASVGGVTCLYVRQVIPASKLRVHTWEVPGISGTGSKVLGYGDSDWQIVAEFWSNAAGVNIWLASIQALQGSIVTIVDDHADSYLLNLITKISQPKKVPAYIPTQGILASVTISGVRK